LLSSIALLLFERHLSTTCDYYRYNVHHSPAASISSSSMTAAAWSSPSSALRCVPTITGGARGSVAIELPSPTPFAGSPVTISHLLTTAPTSPLSPHGSGSVVGTAPTSASDAALGGSGGEGNGGTSPTLVVNWSTPTVTTYHGTASSLHNANATMGLTGTAVTMVVSSSSSSSSSSSMAVPRAIAMHTTNSAASVIDERRRQILSYSSILSNSITKPNTNIVNDCDIPVTVSMPMTISISSKAGHGRHGSHHTVHHDNDSCDTVSSTIPMTMKPSPVVTFMPLHAINDRKA
jgi:hypothetical protein